MTQKTNQNNRELKMLNDPIPKIILEMAVPTIIAFLITSIYNLADERMYENKRKMKMAG